MGDNQSQKAGEGSTLIQAGGNVSIELGVSYAELDRRIDELRRDIAREIVSKAQEMLREAGVQPVPAPLKTLVPLLQYASLEEDRGIQERWAALLANTATTGATTVSLAFIEILRQLSPEEARLLDAFFGWQSDFMLSGRNLSSADALNWQKANWHLLDSPHLAIYLEDLLRHRLIDVEPGIINSDEPLQAAYILTRFGFEFVLACRPPKRGEGE